jgi:Skp family chaperone for outer membrane proteins
VKKTLSCVCLAFAILASAALSQATAQAPGKGGARAPIPGVRIIDLKKIFDGYDRFRDQTNFLKKEVEDRENQLKGLREEMKRLDAQRKDVNPSSPEAKDLEGKLVRMDSEHRSQLTLGKKEFLEKEAKIYFDVYREVIDEVKLYCQYEGVQLVLRFNNDAMPTPDDPQGVLKELNKTVVHHDPAIDITKLIMDELNRRYRASMSQAGRPARPATVPPR